MWSVGNQLDESKLIHMDDWNAVTPWRTVPVPPHATVSSSFSLVLHLKPKMASADKNALIAAPLIFN